MLRRLAIVQPDAPAFWNTQATLCSLRFPILRYPTMPSPEYWRFRGVESLSAQRIASSRQISYKPGHFAEPFRCATARSNGLTHGITYKTSKNDRDKEIIQWITNDKNLYERFILRKDLKIYRLIETIDEIDEGFHPYILSLLVFIAVNNTLLKNLC